MSNLEKEVDREDDKDSEDEDEDEEDDKKQVFKTSEIYHAGGVNRIRVSQFLTWLHLHNARPRVRKVVSWTNSVTTNYRACWKS